MENEEIKIRFAREDESGIVFELIKDLAAYENMEDQIFATEEQIHETLFVKRDAEVLLAKRNNGDHIALFFVDDRFHRKGIGRRLFETALNNCFSKEITGNSCIL